MRKPAKIAVTASVITLAALSCAVSVAAEPKSAAVQLLEKRTQALRVGDVETVLSVYADDAVAIWPQGYFVGKKMLREEGFAFLSQVPKPLNVSFTFEQKTPEVVLGHWTINSGTPQQQSGVDVFVVRNGKVAVQATMPPAPPAPPAPPR